MKVKSGDVVEFLAISWIEPDWDFDHPTVALLPVVSYSDDGQSCESILEDVAIDLCCNDDIVNEDVSHEFEWRGWKLSTLRRVAKNRLAGKDDWKTKIREVVYQQVEFYEEDGELESRVIEQKEA
jgi:hypothetical protein